LAVIKCAVVKEIGAPPAIRASAFQSKPEHPHLNAVLYTLVESMSMDWEEEIRDSAENGKSAPPTQEASGY